ncbi:LZTR1 [Symbiodinium sp. CCMP2592]|nr:LZTR1 [Symbiodinium sp. CCMP2592]
MVASSGLDASGGSGVANDNECPRPCSSNQLRAGNETCTQIFLWGSDSYVFKRTSCRAPGDCEPGLNTKACPSGAFLPVWRQCPLGQAWEGTGTGQRIFEIAKVFGS